MATYDAGIVTAYGAAVRGGYTGTYEQFCTQQANYAASAAAVEQAKEDVQELVESIPADYSQLSDDVSTLKEDYHDIDDRVTTLEEGGGSGSGLTEDIKAALLQMARKVAYVDAQGQTYYDDLYDALYAVTAIRLDANSIMLTSIGSTQQLTATTTPPGGAVTWASSDTSIATVSNTGLVTSVGYGSCTVTASSGSVSATCAVAVSRVTLTSIAADYRQSGTVYDTASLDSLKSDLTVTATYSDSSTATVTEYTLSGTLTAGTSTITVSYGGKTATFNVTVTAAPTLTSISAVYTQSGTVYDTDSLDTLKDDLVVTAHMSDSTTQTVTEYTLSGTLAEGTSTITVTYGGKTTTFTVTVTHVNTIRVYKGKGTSGTSITDNPNRALSEMIDVTGATEIVTQWDYSETQDAVKFTTGDTTISSDSYILVPENYINTSTDMGSYGAWRTATSNLVYAKKTTKWEAQIPASGKIRLLFRNVADASTAIGTISGTMTINGEAYQLVEDTAENFE